MHNLIVYAPARPECVDICASQHDGTFDAGTGIRVDGANGGRISALATPNVCDHGAESWLVCGGRQKG
jgi:hypothetical protein